MVTYEDFKLRVSDLVRKHYENMGRSVDVSLMKVRKTNGVELDGLVISRRDRVSNISPTIYLNSYYQNFLDGKTLVYVLEEIIKVNDANELSNFDIGSFVNFDRAKKHIKCRIINTEMNKELLELVPHLEFLDLSVIFMVEVEQIPGGFITIYNHHLDVWGISEDEVIKAAKDNFSQEEFQITNMFTLLYGLHEADEEMNAFREAMGVDTVMYVLSNRIKLFGAVGILQEKCLEELSELLNGNYFIIPSSIHEVIALEAVDTSEENIAELREMIEEVNETQLRVEEQLSKKLYLYDAATRKLTIA